MEHLAHLLMMTFVGALMSPMTWLIALIVGLFLDNLLAIVIVCVLLRGGLGWMLWMTATAVPDEPSLPIGAMLVFLIPQVAAIFVIALITRAIRHAAGFGGQRG